MASEARTDQGQLAKRDAAFWLAEIDMASTHEEQWRERGAEIERIYRGEVSPGGSSRGAARRDARGSRAGEGTNVNVLYANTELLMPATFTILPPPDIRRRYTGQDDEIGREVALTLEAAVTFSLDDADVEDRAKEVALDSLLPGRGILWVAHEVETEVHDVAETEQGFVDVVTGEPVDPEDVDVDDEGRASAEVKVSERIRVDRVSWRDYRESATAQVWSDVWWVSRRHRMTRRQAIEEFGAATASKLKYAEDSQAESQTDNRGGSAPATGGNTSISQIKRADVWEVWDEDAREVVWVSEGVDDILRNDGDPLRLKDFFPCPMPLQSITTTNTRTPVPEYDVYVDQAAELVEVASRRRHLVRALKAIGLIDASSSQAVIDLSQARDGTMVPVPRPQVSDKTLEQSIEWWPIEHIAAVLEKLGQREAELNAQIFQLTGLSDLMRGDTKASESATAARIKGTFGQFRLGDRASKMAVMLRGLMKLMAEIMAEHFDRQTLVLWSGREVTDEMMQTMRADRLRSVRVDVETGATVAADMEQRKSDAIQYNEAMATVLGQMLPLTQAFPPSAPFVGALIKASARPFKFGREFEETLDQMVDALQAQSQKPEQPEEPSADAQLKSQTDLQTTEMEQETERAGLAQEGDAGERDAILKLIQAGGGQR